MPMLTLRLDTMTHGAKFRAVTLRDHARSGAMDPVLGVDHAYMAGPTFPPHSHVGFSAVSYVFAGAETGLNNRDSIGTKNLIRPGGLHWTAAGQGIVHEEVPAEHGKTAHLFQIFVDLPPARRNAPPFAVSLEPENVPLVQRPGATIRVPLGGFDEARSPLETPTALTLLDIKLDAGATLQLPLAEGHNAFVMPVEGTVTVNGIDFDDDGPEIPAFPVTSPERSLKIEARGGAVQVALFHGPPIARQG